MNHSVSEPEFHKQASKTDNRFRIQQKSPNLHNYTPDFNSMRHNKMGGFQKPSKSVFEIQFEMLSDNELDKLHKAKIAEINQKYKERINSTRENYSRVINFHRTRIREYIARLKLQFRNYVEALQS